MKQFARISCRTWPSISLAAFRREKKKGSLTKTAMLMLLPKSPKQPNTEKRIHKMDQYGCDCVHDDVDYEDDDENAIKNTKYQTKKYEHYM